MFAECSSPFSFKQNFKQSLSLVEKQHYMYSCFKVIPFSPECGHQSEVLSSHRLASSESGTTLIWRSGFGDH